MQIMTIHYKGENYLLGNGQLGMLVILILT